MFPTSGVQVGSLKNDGFNLTEINFTFSYICFHSVFIFLKRYSRVKYRKPTKHSQKSQTNDILNSIFQKITWNFRGRGARTFECVRRQLNTILGGQLNKLGLRTTQHMLNTTSFLSSCRIHILTGTKTDRKMRCLQKFVGIQKS